MRRWLPILLLLFAGATARAADLPILDVAAVPRLNATGQASYRIFLLNNVPRAFAISTSGHSGWTTAATLEQARSKALSLCAAHGGTDCTIYAEDLSVVYPGRSRIDPPPVPGPLITGSGYAFVPDQRYIWHGPQAASGLIVWGHGKSGNQTDESGYQPHNYVRVFNNAGFDVVRFAREPVTDSESNASEWLQENLPKLRAMGWREVVAAGQSTGAWASLSTVDTPGLADAVIAVSAAYLSTANQGAQAAGLYRIIHAAASPNTRVALVYFEGDPYVTEGIDARVEHLRDGLAGRIGPLLVIERPPGFRGHGGANAADFGRRYGPCLLHFVLDPQPPATCDGE
ncbi:MAG TPA: hypothetical protein VK726_23295 [Acetobacteraceae bacterium]|nr:hypothetical protein [Acetobacteraceae bacterium]